ncbi:MAG: hypothetical protein ACRBDL_09335 [Alphaproteobacteria bacterium]
MKGLQKQRGGKVNALEVLECGRKVSKAALRPLAVPYQAFISLDKSTQDILMHKILATGGASMVAAGGVCLAQSGVTAQEMKEYADHLLAVSGHFNVETLSSFEGGRETLSSVMHDVVHYMPDKLSESLKQVWGTMATGAANCGRNIWQWRSVVSDKGHALEVDTFEGRQERRVKQVKSNLISAGTNMPQLVEGLVLLDPVRIFTAGSAVSGYGIRASRYKYAHYVREKGLEGKDPPEFFKAWPWKMLSARAGGQTFGMTAELGTTFGPVAGGVICAAGLCQIAGAEAMRISDRDYQDNGRDGADDSPTL